MTAAFVIFGCYSKKYKKFVRHHLWIQVVFGITSAIIFYVLIYIRKAARTVPLNFILLGIFTLCQSYSVSATTINYDNKTVLIAAILTAVMVISLTIYAFTTRNDFTMCGGLLFVCCAVLIGASFLGMFIQHKFYHLVVSSITVILFSVYIIFDTQLVVGNGGLALELDEYIFGALNLYMDIVIMFLEILKLLGD
jgi:FtsH-binding integral membrane protein